MIQWSSALILAATLVNAFLLQAQSNADSTARMHDAWGEGMSTPNTSLTIKEASRSADGMRFRLYATGAPKDAEFSLVVWPFTQRGPSEATTGITLNETGMAICGEQSDDDCSASGKPNDPFEIPWNPIPGEPIRLGLMSADGSVKLYGKLVPIPIRGEDHGCKADATLLTPGAEILSIEGNGFPAGSEITMGSGSGPEPRAVKGRADSSGRFLGTVLPFKQKSVGSEIRITLTSAQCAPAVNVSLEPPAQ